MAWPLQLSAHARQEEECDPDGSLPPRQVAQRGLPMIAQERGGLAILPAPQAGTSLMNENTSLRVLYAEEAPSRQQSLTLYVFPDIKSAVPALVY